MTVITRQQIFDDLVARLSNFQGRQYSGEIRPDSSFFHELGFVSIDAIVLWENLEQHYGRRLPYQDLIERMRQREAADFEVGELVDFLERHLSHTENES